MVSDALLLKAWLVILVALALIHGCVGESIPANQNASNATSHRGIENFAPTVVNSNSIEKAGATAFSMPKHVTISPEKALELIESGQDIVILDFSSNYGKRHLKGSTPYDIDDPALREKLALLDKSKTYLIYCNTQRRSTIAAGIMEELGFNNIRKIEGGINAWMQRGYYVEP